ncbi:hypothetical protein CcaCcLH18_10866 [Colletotrichum camelliae]|nr:hypothetical protein CcaCcLH18_10866 [Colletotrichum camelliae]
MVRLSSTAILALTLSPVTSASASAPAPAQPPAPSEFGPSAHRARENAAHIFNAVHSAMRQWGSSIHHNGLAVIPATVPRGTMLFHGARGNSTPEGFEWLAFEMEHSEGFARSWRGGGRPAPRPPSKPGNGKPPTVLGVEGEGQRRLRDGDGKKPERPPAPPPPMENMRGYFHTYRANRDLKLLYIDGMAAGKTDMGTLDTQDFLLRGVVDQPKFGEFERAGDICELVRSWRLDGVIRMEIGFESIYCDFTDGLDLVSVLRRPWSEEWVSAGGMPMFEWSRAVGQRYDGIGGGRVRVGFGGMVSGLWYPVNVSNPARRDMPRLGRLEEGVREAMMERARENAMGGKGEVVEWQGVVDMVVSRFADRIGALAEEGEHGADEEGFVSQVLVVTNSWLMYPRDEYDVDVKGMVGDAKERCVRQYLAPAEVVRDEWTVEDGLIHAAVETVLKRICGDLYSARGLLVEAAPKLAAAFSAEAMREAVDGVAGGELGEAVERARGVVKGLKEYLNWSGWKKCRPGCAVDEVCFVAMWPFGMKGDHYSPSCQNRTTMEGRGRGARGGDEEGYWDWEPRP